MLRNYEGHGRGVRSLMTRAGQGDPGTERGIFGLVADVVSAPPEYETAVEAVLGERLRVAFGAELVKEPRRSLDVGEEEGDGAGGEVIAHAA